MKKFTPQTMIAGLLLTCAMPVMTAIVRADDVDTPPPSIRNPGNPLTEKETKGDFNRNPGQLSEMDYDFAVKAAQGGMMEVKAGEIASTKAASPEVKRFGEKMVQDHGKAGQELQQIASQKGATLPTEPNMMQKKHLDHLNSLSGAEFDKAYVSMMVKDHKMDSKEFKMAAENLKDSDLKGFAEKTSPVVDEHKSMIEELDQKVKTSPEN